MAIRSTTKRLAGSESESPFRLPVISSTPSCTKVIKHRPSPYDQGFNSNYLLGSTLETCKNCPHVNCRIHVSDKCLLLIDMEPTNDPDNCYVLRHSKIKTFVFVLLLILLSEEQLAPNLSKTTFSHNFPHLYHLKTFKQ